MDRIRILVKKVVPESIIRNLTGYFYGWHGHCSSWKDAASACEGYNSSEVFKAVLNSSRKVRDGMVVYERDSMIFDKIQYSWGLLSGLLWVAAQNRGSLNVLDFGGALGSTYYQNRIFLDALPALSWSVVEQESFVSAGKAEFESEKLKFYFSIEECFRDNQVDLVLCSSVLQYLEKPYEFLDSVFEKDPAYLIIDRTPFVKGPDRLTAQKVNPRIYQGSYPCWFFNEKKFEKYFEGKYELIAEFEALDRANIRSEFKGFIYRSAKLAEKRGIH
jgi:putative methyltransferase (TIGR04325 family)